MHLFQRASDQRWEEVDAFTAEHASQALADEKDEPRYNGNSVVIDGGNITLTGTFSPNDLRWILRFSGNDSGLNHVAVPGGMQFKPDMIRFVIRGKKMIHALKTGETYKLVA